MIKGKRKGKGREWGKGMREFDYANDWNWWASTDWQGSADDGKGVVLCLHRTREGSNILAEAYYLIWLLLFQFLFFRGGSSREGRT